MQCLDSCFIANHTYKKDSNNIKSQPQNDTTQQDPESNVFSNQPRHDLVSPDDTTPFVNNTITTSDTKEFSNINTNEPITVDKSISVKLEVQYKHFIVTTPVKQNDMTLKNCEKNVRKYICKLEAQLCAIKSYVNCKFSILTYKIESISNDCLKIINSLLEKEKRKIGFLKQNMTF